jgi:hypothetical protein
VTRAIRKRAARSVVNARSAMAQQRWKRRLPQTAAYLALESKIKGAAEIEESQA